MKIFSTKQLYEADKFTIQEQQITGEQLMERAAIALFEWIHHRIKGAPVRIGLFCGIGNNGGDGLALARHLWEHGYHIDVYIVNYSEKRSEEFLINLKRLKERKIWPQYLDESTDLPGLEDVDMVIDAIFGIGLNRVPALWVRKLILEINKTDAFVLSIDIPSGLFLEKPQEAENSVVHATYVLSIQAPKLVFFLPTTGIFVDHWEVLDIGLDREYLTKTDTTFELTDRDQVKTWYRQRDKFSHKGNYGHVQIIGGSYGKIGAVILACRAALRSGCGLITAYIPKCGYIPFQSALAEAMVITSEDELILNKIENNIVADADAIGIGIGLGIAEKTKNALENFLDGAKGPLVLDADALNILSKNKKLLGKLPSETILTPHPKELERLVGAWKNDFEKLKKVMQFSAKYGCILVIKGAYSMVVFKDKAYINDTGNPGMATAGSGDVLTGIITSFLAQGYTSVLAARFGVYLHGLAGDIAADQFGMDSMIAGDIIENLGLALKTLMQQEPPKTEEAEQKKTK